MKIFPCFCEMNFSLKLKVYPLPKSAAYIMFMSVYVHSSRTQKHANRKKEHEQYEDRTNRHSTNDTTADIKIAK